MKLKEKLEILADYFAKSRRVGHTRLMRNGIDNVKDKLVLGYKKECRNEFNCGSEEIISWVNFKKEDLAGYKKPLAIDNSVMIMLLNESLNEINKLEEENLRLKGNLIKLAI